MGSQGLSIPLLSVAALATTPLSALHCYIVSLADLLKEDGPACLVGAARVWALTSATTGTVSLM